MVRQQVGLGRFLPLGGPYDGAWIAERAAGGALREAAEREVPEVRLDGIRLGLADPDRAADPAVPPPPSALPPGPLRLTAEFAATAAWPLPETASRLRTALAVAATERLGLDVAEVDLRVTKLLDEEPGAGRGGTAGTPEGADEPGVAQTPDGPHGSGAAGTPGGATGAGARTLPRARARLTRRGWPALPAGRARRTPHTLSAVMPQREQRMTVAPGRKANGSPMRCRGCPG